MKNSLPRNYSLADLLRVDPIGSLNRKLNEAFKTYSETHPDLLATARKVHDAMEQVREAHPLEHGKLRLPKTCTPDERATLAKMLAVTEDEIDRAMQHSLLFHEIYQSVFPPNKLIRSWRALKARAPIRNVGPEDFPLIVTRPTLVLFSADWCAPCRIMRPTFARLARFFSKADVRYYGSDEGRKELGVSSIPRLVAYFPDRTEVHSSVPTTTQNIWDRMNNLILLGEGFHGKGRLVCTDEKCEIVPTTL